MVCVKRRERDRKTDRNRETEKYRETETDTLGYSYISQELAL